MTDYSPIYVTEETKKKLRDLQREFKQVALRTQKTTTDAFVWWLIEVGSEKLEETKGND